MANTVRRVRTCDVCEMPYRPTYYEQRACGRVCGVTLKRVDGSYPPLATPVAWKQCRHCAAWYTHRGKRRCDCGRYEPTSGIVSVACKDCGASFGYVIVSNHPARCLDCRVALKRDQRKRRKARQRGVQTEPVNVRKVYERDKWRCGLCTRRVDKRLVYPDPMSASLDHILPLAHGGAHSMANVQLAHLKCNYDKRDGGTQQLALVG